MVIKREKEEEEEEDENEENYIPPKLAIGFVGMRNSGRSRRISRSWSGRCGSRRRRPSSSASPRGPSRGSAASCPAPRSLSGSSRPSMLSSFCGQATTAAAMSGGGRVRAGRGPCPSSSSAPSPRG